MLDTKLYYDSFVSLTDSEISRDTFSMLNVLKEFFINGETQTIRRTDLTRGPKIQYTIEKPKEDSYIIKKWHFIMEAKSISYSNKYLYQKYSEMFVIFLDRSDYDTLNKLSELETLYKMNPTSITKYLHFLGNENFVHTDLRKFV